jgi:hypothetical protein
MKNKLNIYDEKTKEHYEASYNELRVLCLMKKILDFVLITKEEFEDNNLTFFQLGNFNSQISYILSVICDKEDRLHFTDFKNWEVLISVYNKCFHTEYTYDYNGMISFKKDIDEMVNNFLEDKIIFEKKGLK